MKGAVTKAWIPDAWAWLMYKVGSIVYPSFQCHGVRVRLFFLDEGEQKTVRERIDTALGLIETTHPLQMQKVRRHLASITVLPVGICEYKPRYRACLLPFETVVGSAPLRLAMTIVHEACHGRLYDRGIRKYPDAWQDRIEQICVAQEVLLARRFADEAEGERWAAYALRTLESGSWDTDSVGRRKAAEKQKLRNR